MQKTTSLLCIRIKNNNIIINAQIPNIDSKKINMWSSKPIHNTLYVIYYIQL